MVNPPRAGKNDQAGCSNGGPVNKFSMTKHTVHKAKQTLQQKGHAKSKNKAIKPLYASGL